MRGRSVSVDRRSAPVRGGGQFFLLAQNQSCLCGEIEGGELAQEELRIGCSSNHGRVVGGEWPGREKDREAMFAGFSLERLPKLCVGGNAAGDKQGCHLESVSGGQGFENQILNHR